MLLGVVLLYVGAVLGVNGLWLIGQAREAAAAPRAPEPAGGAVVTAPGNRLLFDNREVAIMNLFTGAVGAVVAAIYLVQGNAAGDLASIRSGGFILLFAFTYLYVMFNQLMGHNGRAFGWYCLFVAITAVPAGIYTLDAANGNTASIWLGIDWFAWAILWFMFFVLLGLERPILRLTGWCTVIVAVGTSWALGFALLEGKVAF